MSQRAKGYLRRRGFVVGLLTLGLLYVPVTVVGTQEAVVVNFDQEKDPIPKGWELSEREGKANLVLVPDGGTQALKLRSNSSSFSLDKELEIDLTKTPYLEWQWKVTELPKGGDFRESVTDDQAAQLYVVLHWGTFSKQAIAYIWDTTAPLGTTEKISPPIPFMTVHAVVVRSGEREMGKWVTETRNVVEDYEKLFGSKPKKVKAIRIQINSQHTKSEAESHWRFVRFKAQP
jgi:hypothetical protein